MIHISNITLKAKEIDFTFQFQNNRLVLDTHTVKVSRFFFHFRDLQEQSPDFTSELEWDSFVNSPMKLIDPRGVVGACWPGFPCAPVPEAPAQGSVACALIAPSPICSEGSLFQVLATSPRQRQSSQLSGSTDDWQGDIQGYVWGRHPPCLPCHQMLKPR